MNLPEKIVAALSKASVAGGRIFPHNAPRAVHPPYITYFRITETPKNTLDDQPTLYHTHLQLDCFDHSYAGVLAVTEAVSQAFSSPTSGLHYYLNLSQDWPASETGEYRIRMDFSFWHTKE